MLRIPDATALAGSDPAPYLTRVYGWMTIGLVVSSAWWRPSGLLIFILGALTLYLDLINIFIRVPAILGGRRRPG